MEENDLPYEFILFDLDGTISDPKEGIVNSIKYALSKYGLEENDDKYLENFIGPSLFEAFKRFYSFGDEEVKKVVECYREYYSAYGIYENKIYPGIKELLKYLKEQDKKLLIATSKPTVFAKRVVDYFNLDDYFTGIYGCNLDGSRVDKAEIIKDILFDLDVSSEGCNDRVVMVGDRKYDIIGAKENGTYSIGVLYGYGSREELEAFSPDYLAATVKDLRKILA